MPVSNNFLTDNHMHRNEQWALTNQLLTCGTLHGCK